MLSKVMLFLVNLASWNVSEPAPVSTLPLRDARDGYREDVT
jgi:hypothetical protein